MLTDGLEWCGLLVDYCDVFISCLDSHSDGTHSLQSIHCWASDAMLHFWWRNKLICILDGMKVSTFSAIFHCWMYYSFKSYLYTNSLYQHNFGNLVCFPLPEVSQRSRMIRDTPGHLLLGKKTAHRYERFNNSIVLKQDHPYETHPTLLQTDFWVTKLSWGEGRGS